MNKYIISLLAVLSLLLTVFFFLWRNEVKDNAILNNEIKDIKEQVVKLNAFNEEKDNKIKQIQTKYNNVISNYVGTECENQKVSAEMIEALKSLGE